MTKVYFTDMRCGFRKNVYHKIEKLFTVSGLKDIFEQDDLVAIKLHFGEIGGTAFIKPILVRRFVELIKEGGGRPFLTDTTTLYVGDRKDATGCLKVATRHGFVPAVVDAPIIIADGIRGQSVERVEINMKHTGVAKIASDLYHADALLVLSHFKLHLATGIGGAVKNTAMGGASRPGKLFMHSSVNPFIVEDQCNGCRRCFELCPPDAISLKENKKAIIDQALCIGCAECIALCPEGAISIRWDADFRELQEKMVEYLAAVIKNKKGKVGYVTFLTDITPDCDCMSHSDLPIVPDIGILASLDPIAIDQAACDLVNNAEGLVGSSLGGGARSIKDKIRAIHPKIDWTFQLKYGEEVGLGSRKYELVKVS